MPVYGMKVRGEDKLRVVLAKTAAQARDHIVEAKPLTAVQLAEACAAGATVERAGEEPPAPEPEKESEQAPADPPADPLLDSGGAKNGTKK